MYSVARKTTCIWVNKENINVQDSTKGNQSVVRFLSSKIKKAPVTIRFLNHNVLVYEWLNYMSTVNQIYTKEFLAFRMLQNNYM